MYTLQEWQANGTFIDFKGHKIFTAVYGNASSTSVLLTLHGFPTASYDFARITPLLADQYRVIVFDMLGYGFSDKPRTHDYSLFEQADIAEAVMAHYGVLHCALLSHDMGDSVALELLRRDLNRADKQFSRLILMNGSLLLEYYQPLITQRLLLHPIAGKVVSGLNLIGFRAFSRQFSSLFVQRPPQNELKDFWSLVTTNEGNRIYHRLIRYLNERKIHEEAWLNALAAHPARLTVIWGQRDPVSVPKIGDEVVKHRPDATYLKLADVGHYPQWETPEVVVTAVKEAITG
ncbi:MAG: alpha/beta hydrolase [Anaerolineae bacterium]